MMNKNFTTSIFILALSLSVLPSCVSVQIPNAVIEKAKNVSVKAPASPFRSSKSPSADEMWVSHKTASTISYFTSCSSSEPALKAIRTNAFASLEKVDVTKEEEVQINEREGLKSNIEGKMEGIPVKIQFIVFKKNSCSYHLSYVALKENFDKELDQFTNFVRSFKVP
jgi:hypothetical protein